MTIPRAGRRDSVEASIVAALRARGYLVTQGGALCDLIVYAHNIGLGFLTLLEVKGPKGKLTAAQQKAIAAGWPIVIVRSVAEALDAVG